MAADKTRVITAHVPEELASKVDEIAAKMDRSKAWVVKQALNQYVEEEQAKYEMTLEAIKSIDEGNFVTHEEMKTWAENLYTTKASKKKA
ncbi:MAG TPA: ribbon-helix-helix domain-containing protein [Limnobacter sp.]|nr:ribbon-helix-helix domain-containing protein [Limnobacter sp.]